MTQTRRVSATRRLALKYRPSPPGKASDCIQHFKDVQATDVVLYCRVSLIEQYRNGNLGDQVAHCRRLLERQGANIIAVYHCIETSSELDDWMDRPTLATAIATAKKWGAVLVVETTSRLIRSLNYYYERNQQAQPTEIEFEKLLRLCNGVTLATLEHPNASSGEERSYQTKRGQEAKGRKGGRPMSKKGRRKKLKPSPASYQ